jgi:ABC-type transport system involved in multi-copper enzyme maturation permease subunit
VSDYQLETARATLDACTADLSDEERRMQTVDGKLTQLAAFSGVSLSISASVGGSVVAARHLSLGFSIALGACLVVASALLLSAVIVAFRALSPKLYHGVDEAAVIDRTTPNALEADPAEAMARFAASRRDILIIARGINDQKADATAHVFVLVGLGFAALVLGVVVTTVGSVV